MTAGCSGGDGLYAVRGVVTFEGVPVEKGRILFRKVEGDQRAFGAQIIDGEYALKTEPGPMTVQITGSRIIPGKFTYPGGPGSDPEPVGENFIPEWYNTKTTLKVNVAPSHDNEVPFDLTAKRGDVSNPQP